MDKTKALICSVVLSILSLLPFVVSAQTTITASVVLNQTVLDGYTWPITIQGGTIDNPVVVRITENIALTNVANYFIIGSEYVTFDGNNNTIIIDNVNSYPGLIQNGSFNGPVNGYSNITIKNINVSVSVLTTTLIIYGGWIGQDMFGYNATNVTIDNCHSSGPQTNNAGGGIVGRYSPATVTNCSSTGAIHTNGGGICGKFFSGTVVNCYSTGAIGSSAGGIMGNFSTGTAINCYSTGNIGSYAGGIMGSDAGKNIAPVTGITTTPGATATNCYSRGNITGNYASGIMAQKSYGTVTNCYSTGNITGIEAGGIVGYQSSATVINCYTIGAEGTYSRGITSSVFSGRTDNCLSSYSGSWSDSIASRVLTGIDGTVWIGYRDGVEEPFTLTSITPFVTTWQIDGNNQIIIPLMGDGYDFYIDWGDENIEYRYDPSGDISHTYLNSVSDNYTVTITPKTFTGFPRIYLNEFSNSNLLLEIKQWGGGEWSNMNNSFSGASNLQITANDIPNLSRVTDLSSMFYNNSSLNSDLSGWDVSHVTDMNSMFNGASSFNQNIGNWKVLSVTNMSAMFNGAAAFNQNIGNWKVLNVTDMNSMFNSASSFNRDLIGWDVSSVTNMSNMFFGAQKFNGNISGWDVSKVTDLSFMFYNASSFNSDLNNWNVSKVTNMENMFSNASTFNNDLNNWDVSSVTNMSNMFSGAQNFNRDLISWSVSNVTNMENMFNNASSFNSDISTWNAGSVTNMSNMFSGAQNFNRDLSSWNMSNVTNMENMFNNASSFNSDISTWNAGSVTNMSNMFSGAQNFNRDLSSWNMNNVTNMSNMFNGATSFNADLGGWNVSNVTDMSSMFSDAIAFDQDLSTWNIASVTNASNFLTNGKLSTENYDALLLGWSNQILGSLTINFGNSKYSNTTSVITARAYLTDTKNWSIIDGGMYTPPLISSTLLALNNSTIQVTFSERVYSDINGTSDLEATDFSYTIAGGSATLTAVTPVIISTTDNISFILGIGLTGKTDGVETLTISPVADAIYNLAGDVAIITQSNNTALLYEPLVTRNGQIGTTDSSYVDKNGKTGSVTGLNPSGKAIVTRSTND